MKPDGGPAFPQTLDSTQTSTRGCIAAQGISLRDYFASNFFGVVLIDAESYSHAAALAYEAADAMLAEREKE